jgi:hypothetical protein
MDEAARLTRLTIQARSRRFRNLVVAVVGLGTLS